MRAYSHQVQRARIDLDLINASSKQVRVEYLQFKKPCDRVETLRRL